MVAMSSASLKAQDYSLQTGAPTFTTAEPVELGFLNLANGNLHLEVPFGMFPQRGARPFAAALVYDSRIYKITSNAWQPTNVPNSQGGWRYIDTGVTGSVTPLSTQTFSRGHPVVCTYIVISNFQWIAPDGTQRMFPISTEQQTSGDGCPDRSSTSGFANDASGFKMFVTNYTHATVYAPDGTQVFPTVKDTNGNFFSNDGNGNVIDTLGRTPIMKTTNCNGNSSQTCYNILNSQGGRSTITVTTESIFAETTFFLSGVTDYVGNITVIQSIKLPDNTTYQFGYDSTGELSSITFPTGGVVYYSYTSFHDAFGNANLWATTRISGGSWSYTPTVVTTCGSGQVGCQQKVSVIKPSGDNCVYTFTLNNGAWKSQKQDYTGPVSSANLVSTVSNTWDFSQTCSPTPCNGASNIRILTTQTTLPTPGGGSISNQTATTYADTNTMNIGSVKAWKFYAGSFPTAPDRETDFTYHPVLGNNMVDRVTQTTIKGSAGTVVAQTNFSYDDPGSLSNSTPASGIQNHDDTNYSLSNTVRGDLTITQRCTNLSSCTSSPVTTTMTYDTTGQALSVKDPNTNVTSFNYADIFYNDAADAGSIANPPATYTPLNPTNAYLTSVTPPVSSAGTTTFGYYFGTGKRAQAKDGNNADSYSHFVDLLDRLTHSFGPTIGGSRPWALNVYATTDTQVDSYLGITDTVAAASCTSCRNDRVVLDNLGRPTQSSLVNDPEQKTMVDTVYDSSGRVQTTSHPYRTTNDATYGLETPTYDGLNRITKVTHPNTTYSQTLFGAAVSGTGVNATQRCSSTTYGLSYPTLFIDEAGKKREVWTDGFGRTIEGDEPDSSGNLTTGSVACYQYDSLGNLLQVVSGSQTRTFTYNSLSRVTSATTPEAGAVCFGTYSGGVCQGDGYDANGNLITRTTPAPNQTGTATVTTNYFHDGLNRLTKITYGATPPVTTPTVQYAYDGNSLSGCTTAPPTLTDSNPKGRMTSMCDGSGATSWAHDPAGRIVTEKRLILGSPALTTSYSYNLDGSIATVTYPSGKTITYTTSNAQRLTAAKDVANNIQFVTAASYAPPGALSGMITGQISGGFGGVTESHNYNNSLEYTTTKAQPPTGPAALDLTLNYNLPGGDNGTVTTVTNNADNGRTQTLTYDSLNRILSAQSSNTTTGNPDCWGQVFGPNGSAADDALGNFTNINSGTQTQPPCQFGMLTVGVDGNNHIATSGYGYDAAGNMSQDGSGYAYSFDAESRLVQATGMSGGPYCYVYDGNGLRVAKKSNSNSTCTTGTVVQLYWRSLSGDALAETDVLGNTLNEYAFFAGRRVAARNGSGAIFYYFADQLGSIRSITTGGGPGQTAGQLCYDADFSPYGQEMQHTERLQTTACPPSYRFTGYEYDSETGLSYAFARFYSPRLGRFLSIDPLRGSIGNLQSHNAYAYVVNNPLNITDSSGLGPSCGQTKFGANSQFCNPGSGVDFGCSLDGVIESCATVGQLAQGLAIAGVSDPLPLGNGTIIIWLSGGSITTINHNDWGGMMEYSEATSYFDGEWVTLPQFIGMVKSYYAGLGILSDDERLKIVARGVVNQAGLISDWRFIAGFYVASFGSAAIDAVITDYASGPLESNLFGRFNPAQGGGFPGFLNDPAYLVRLGYGWNGEIGQMVFRLSVEGVGHIFEWVVPFP